MVTLAPVNSIDEVLKSVQEAIAPLWPLQDYVAVNPFVGLIENRFLDVKQSLDQVRAGAMLMPLDYYRERFAMGSFSRADIEQGVAHCAHEYPEYYDNFTADSVYQSLLGSSSANAGKSQVSDRKYFTISEKIDNQYEGEITAMLVSEISRFVSAHYDRGQAFWVSPWKDLPLWNAWREASAIDRRMEKLGIEGFRRFVSNLPEDPVKAIERMLAQLGVPAEHWDAFLKSELFSISGWASYVKYRVRDAAIAGVEDQDLVGLLAIRLACDVAVRQSYPGFSVQICWPETSTWSESIASASNLSRPNESTLQLYVLQVATEIAYRNSLGKELVRHHQPSSPDTAKQPLAQMVFCIDVRSELIRRNLERVSDEIETFGFAGFFAMALEYVSMGDATGAAQCPVLLTPGFKVHEGLRGAAVDEQSQAIYRKRVAKLSRGVWKSFQTSATACFSFVESLGALYAFKMMGSVLGFSRPVAQVKYDGLTKKQTVALGPVLHDCHTGGLSLERKTDLAQNMLRNLGLTDRFARLVVICGHGCETTNNPYKAGLDCGACGGHTGEPNARVAATILNDFEVRQELQKRGINVPAETWFLAALHNTTTDEITFNDLGEMPTKFGDDFKQLAHWSLEAGQLTRQERAMRMNVDADSRTTADNLIWRSQDWSEVRPEWGLAGNAAFIVAPRSRTTGMNLQGRTFLHSYEFSRDENLKVLELIMTAPMVVTNWINMQYYASSVDNLRYGSGNKAIHNVVGQLGVVLGNGGDLMTGLPWQSVHDGKQYQHEPLRLFVAIEAPREAIQTIIDRHAMVRDLVSHGWITLASIEQDQLHQFVGNSEWRPIAG